MKVLLFVILSVAFFLFGINEYIISRPSYKNNRIYKIIQKYNPYYLEKRFGGLQIKNRENPDFLEKPDNSNIFHRFEALEKSWAKDHLVLKNDTLNIVDSDKRIIKTIYLENRDEKDFVNKFYGLR